MYKVLWLFFVTSLLQRPVMASEQDLYDFLWLDPDKKVYVLQNKIYKRKHSLYADVGFIKNLSSDFQSTTGVAFKIGYFVTEDWSFEMIYNKYDNSPNSTYQNLQKVNGVEPFLRNIESNLGFLAVWTPFYGKINTFNSIIYFDWSFGVGPTFIGASSNALSAVDPNSNAFRDEKFAGAMGKSSLKFHINKNWHINAEYQHSLYKARGPIAETGKTWRSNSDLIIGIGFSF